MRIFSPGDDSAGGGGGNTADQGGNTGGEFFDGSGPKDPDPGSRHTQQL